MHASSVLWHLYLGRSEWPEALVPQAAYERLVAAAPSLPEPITGLFIECHLSDHQRTDFGVRLSRKDRDGALTTGRCPDLFRDFFRLWQDEDHPAARLETVDIEHDMGDCRADPFISPGLEPDLMAGFEAIEMRSREEIAAGKKRFALEVGRPVLRALDPTLPDALFAQVERCSDALPPYGVVIPVWPGSSRPGALPVPAIRATVALPRFALREYLTSLGWTGDVGRLERHADLLESSGPWIGFDVDILESGLGSRIGLYQEHWWVRPWDLDLQGTLDRLDRLRLCAPSRLSGFRAWVASQPDKPADGQARSLSLKLVLNGQAPPVVKAYISTFDEADAIRSLSQSSAGGTGASRMPIHNLYP